jgi:hypothetical protein
MRRSYRRERERTPDRRLVGDSGSTLVIYGRQKEHVTAFDERFVLSRNLCQHHARLNVVSKPPRVEAVLQ